MKIIFRNSALLFTVLCLLTHCSANGCRAKYSQTKDTFVSALERAVDLDIQCYIRSLAEQKPTRKQIQELLFHVACKERRINSNASSANMFTGQLAMAELMKLQHLKVALLSLLASASSSGTK